MEDVHGIVCVREGRGREEGGRGERGEVEIMKRKGKEHAKYIPMLSCTSHLWFLLLGACQPR